MPHRRGEPRIFAVVVSISPMFGNPTMCAVKLRIDDSGEIRGGEIELRIDADDCDDYHVGRIYAVPFRKMA